MHSAGCGCLIAAGQVGRGRSVFQQRFEHGVWSARNGKHLIENYYRSRGCVHAGCTNAFAAGGHGLSFGFAIERSGSDAGATAFARSQCRTGGIAGSFGGSDCFAERFEVARFAQQQVTQTVSLRSATLISGDHRKLTVCVTKLSDNLSRSGGTGRRARLRGV